MHASKVSVKRPFLRVSIIPRQQVKKAALLYSSIAAILVQPLVSFPFFFFHRHHHKKIRFSMAMEQLLIVGVNSFACSCK
jgi:hypothetical protein